jgi:hypothetical protein
VNTVEQTVNPYNKNKDGQPKTECEIRAELRVQLQTWMGEAIICASCESSANTRLTRREETERKSGMDSDDDDDEGCCLPGRCVMPGPHRKSECHTPDMIESSFGQPTDGTKGEEK